MKKEFFAMHNNTRKWNFALTQVGFAGIIISLIILNCFRHLFYMRHYLGSSHSTFLNIGYSCFSYPKHDIE